MTGRPGLWTDVLVMSRLDRANGEGKPVRWGTDVHHERHIQVGGTMVLALWLVAASSPLLGQSRIAVPSYVNPGDPTWTAWEAQGPGAGRPLYWVSANRGSR